MTERVDMEQLHEDLQAGRISWTDVQQVIMNDVVRRAKIEEGTQVEHPYKGYVLEITQFGVDVWNPANGTYEAMKVSMEDAIRTVDGLIPDPEPVARLREKIQSAIAKGYTEGDVNHHVQPVIGQLQRTVRRTTEHGGTAIAVDVKDMNLWVRKLTAACEAEVAWLNTPDVEG